ncbi:MAG TPA: DNA mismatch repair protein MutS, partial [Lachnospiraceae bacterium]|nr:DNA mismatch repair protein MutS [Lachnospiraceae bacterium]
MMQHYLQTKREYPGCILFYRLGDFYEMFFEDAEIVSRELELTLTGKSCGLPERAPMCGVPYHAVDSYLTRLVEKGYRAAICEQVEDPRTAKGMVKREVVRIVTPGTNLDMESIDEGKNNFIFCILYGQQGKSGISVADVTTGEFFMTESEGDRKIYDEIIRYSPSEIICNEGFMLSGIDLRDLQDRMGIVINTLGHHYFDEGPAAEVLKKHFRVSSLIALGMEDKRAGSTAAGALLRYLYDTQKNSLSNITGISVYASGKYMLLDSSTRRNLELTETMREKKKRGSLMWVLDRTCTAMGARRLHQMIEQPLIDAELIRERLDAVESLCQNTVDRDEIREYLQPVYDLERLMTRVSYGSANPRDLIALRRSLKMFAPIRQVLSDFEGGLLEKLRDDMEDFDFLVDLLERSIEDEPPIQVREGGMIKAGFDEDIDRLREAKTQGRQWLMNLEAEDQERTGIRNLKIKYNKVFGYYFEVTNSFKNLVPKDYQRKQTLVGAERYTSDKLKSLEDTIL